MRNPVFTIGDLNALFALLLDNVVNLVVLTGLLTAVFGMPADFVLTRMVPGTAIGVMVGDLAYTWLARRNGPHATAMPLGLDTPSTIGLAVAVIGPVFVASGDAMTAWEVGMATLVCMGVVKLALSFAGDAVLRTLPRAGLLGPLAGVGLALLGLFPVLKVFSAPIAGLVATGILLFALVAKLPMPGRMPGALAAVVAGLVLTVALRALGLEPPADQPESLPIGLHWPWPGVQHVFAGLPRALDFLPIAIPFGLLTVVGGINVTESARAAGDEYRTRDILLVEAVATLVAGLLGGVAQSTPYIGHPAYKAMGARSGYTLGVGLLIGIGGVAGVLGVVVQALPEVAVAPILLFVGLEITVQAFEATPRRHWSAVAFSVIPVLAYLVSIYSGQLIAAGARPAPPLAHEVETIQLLSRGFILTAMLWGSAVAFLVDRRPLATLWTFWTLALFSLFGVVHSVDPSGALSLPDFAVDPRPGHLAAAYALTGVLLSALTHAARSRPGAATAQARHPPCTDAIESPADGLDAGTD